VLLPRLKKVLIGFCCDNAWQKTKRIKANSLVLIRWFFCSANICIFAA
jgi:hypothetical protein